MIDRELEAKRRLVALARKKAERNGTTLEAKVEKWLTLYVNEADDVTDRLVIDPTPSNSLAPHAILNRVMKPSKKTGTSSGSGSDTRSAAYRRLLGVINDSPNRTS